ncbi:hypothetical protein ACWCPJ_36875 [Streptomyces collinus]
MVGRLVAVPLDDRTGVEPRSRTPARLSYDQVPAVLGLFAGGQGVPLWGRTAAARFCVACRARR